MTTPLDALAAPRVERPRRGADGRPDAVAPAPAAPMEAAEAAAGLKLAVMGFTQMERRLLEGTVRLSERRAPRLDMLDESYAAAADVVMIDTRDPAAMAWAQRQPWLIHKAVIWVDATNVASGHTSARRPVQWPVLPMLLARALKQGPGTADAAAPAAPPETRAYAPTATHQTGRPILVVDDSLAARAYLRSLLEQLGYVVSDADSVEAALELVTRQAFDCVLMDVLMPGADGYAGCRQIKARLRGDSEMPVVMLTSKSSPFDRIRGKMAGCDAYLTKPVDAEQLNDVLEQQTRTAQRRAESRTASRASGYATAGSAEMPPWVPRTT